MAWRKVKDLAVVAGSYTDGSGQQKNRYKNVGSIIKGDGPDDIMIMLDRSFNPAGVPFRPDKPEHVVINVFTPREPNSNARPAAEPRGDSASPQPQAGDVDDDIPF